VTARWSRRSGPFILLGWMLAASLGGIAGEARADGREDAAKASFRRAAEAYARRDYRAAAQAFDAAQRILPNGATAYNAGLAWARVPGEELKAAADLDAAVASGELDGAQATDARQRLDQLEQRVGHLDIVAGTGARVAIDGEGAGPSPARRRVSVGEHEVVVTFADGRISTRTVSAARGVATHVEIEEPAAAPPPPPVTPQPPRADEPRAEARAPAGQDTGASRDPLHTAGWIGVAAGVVLGAAATYLVVTGVGARDDFEASGRHDAGLRDTAIAHRTWGTVSLVGAIALGAAGIMLLVTSHPRTRAE
jgi:hypothetical protein